MANVIELAQNIYKLQEEIETLKKEASERTKKRKELEATLAQYKDEIFPYMVNVGNPDALVCSVDNVDIVAVKSYTPTTGYTNESDVISWLKNNNYQNLIRTTVSEALQKNDIKAQLKVDTNLQEGLKPFILNGKTEYVVVTDKANYQKMLAHMSKDGK